MAASAGAWYRVGTVSVTNNNAAIVGIGSNWQNDVIAIAIGDAFTIDAKTWYEVISVNDDTSITLDRGFEGATASDVEYAILRNTSGTILTRIAGQIAVQFNQKQLFLDELRNWLTSEDETATLTDSHGIAHVVKTVNKIQELVGTAASADVVESITDATANRLLKVGYGGLGGGAILTADFDAINVNGFYQSLLGTTTGAPFGGRQYSLVHNSFGTGTGNDRASQVAIEVLPATTGKFMYFRTREDGIWTGWQEIYHSGNTNFNEFIFNANDVKLCYARVAGQLFFELAVNGFSSPTSATVTGTFSVIDLTTGSTIISDGVPEFLGASSSRILVMRFTGSFTPGANYLAYANAGGATIKANF